MMFWAVYDSPSERDSESSGEDEDPQGPALTTVWHERLRQEVNIIKNSTLDLLEEASALRREADAMGELAGAERPSRSVRRRHNHHRHQLCQRARESETHARSVLLGGVQSIESARLLLGACAKLLVSVQLKAMVRPVLTGAALKCRTLRLFKDAEIRATVSKAFNWMLLEGGTLAKVTGASSPYPDVFTAIEQVCLRAVLCCSDSRQ